MLAQCLKIFLILGLMHTSTAPPFDVFSTALTLELFDSWKCSSLCQNPNLIESICVYLRNQRVTEGIRANDDAWVRQNSKCETFPVEFKNRNGEFYTRQKQVGMCYLTKDNKFCVTYGEKQKDAFVYAINNKNACQLHFSLDNYASAIKNAAAKKAADAKKAAEAKKAPNTKKSGGNKFTVKLPWRK